MTFPDQCALPLLCFTPAVVLQLPVPTWPCVSLVAMLLAFNWWGLYWFLPSGELKKSWQDWGTGFQLNVGLEVFGDWRW